MKFILAEWEKSLVERVCARRVVSRSAKATCESSPRVSPSVITTATSVTANLPSR